MQQRPLGSTGLTVSALGLIASAGYLYLGQRMLGRERLPCIARSIALAVIFPSGLILANTRATRANGHRLGHGRGHGR